MPRFHYQAKNVTGQVMTGEVEAGNQQEAIVRLRAQQLVPLKVSLVGATQAGPGMFSQTVKGKDLQVFTRQFSTLINAGIPVVDSLKILSEGLRPGLLKESSARVKQSIESGRRLSDSMAQVPQVFDRLYVNMIQAGEETGILDSILQRLAIHMEKSEKIRSQVKGALAYPMVIIVVAIIVITGILVFIIPKFTEFFTASGKEPPWLTMQVVGLSRMLVDRWYIFAFILVVLPVVFMQYIKTKEGREFFDRFLMRAPVIGEVVQKSSIARLTRTLSTLLSSGVGLIQAIDISAKTAGNFVIEQALLRSKESVTAGKPFASPLTKEKVFPDMVVQMISIGEQSGTLDIMLGKIADFYEDEVETSVKAMTSLLEPLLMVILGGIIAVLVIAMYLPVFSMGDIVQ